MPTKTWTSFVLAASLLAVGACSAPLRPPLQVEEITTGGAAQAQKLADFRTTETERILARAEAIALGQTSDDTLDLLAISGGADWGAFGAGYLARWKQLGDAAAIPMPEFDIIGGISTGSLIGTYVASGTQESYDGIEEFYRKSDPDWVSFNGIFSLLPDSKSLYDTTGVRDQVSSAVDDKLIDQLQQAHAANRPIIAATTNLDFGELQFWDVATIAATSDAPKERIVDVLMGATAIPGAFPPVEIDGQLQADGGAVQGVPAIDPTRLPQFAQIWRQRHPNLELPLLRFWFIYNNQLVLKPEAVKLAWPDIMFRSYQTISQTSFKAPVQASILAAAGAAATGAPPFEVRWIAIPDSYVPIPGVQPFDPRTTNALADIGQAAAALPDGGWQSTYPR